MKVNRYKNLLKVMSEDLNDMLLDGTLQIDDEIEILNFKLENIPPIQVVKGRTRVAAYSLNK